MNKLSWFLVYCAFAALLLALDQWTKSLALTHLVYHQPVAVMPFFNFTLTFNTGSLFGAFHQYGEITNLLLTLLTLVIALILIIWLWRAIYSSKCLSVAIVMVLAGALGNLIDRLQYGMVVDFIDWYVGTWHWPTFNVADMSIVTGVILLLLFWKPDKK